MKVYEIVAPIEQDTRASVIWIATSGTLFLGKKTKVTIREISVSHENDAVDLLVWEDK